MCLQPFAPDLRPEQGGKEPEARQRWAKFSEQDWGWRAERELAGGAAWEGAEALESEQGPESGLARVWKQGSVPVRASAEREQPSAQREEAEAWACQRDRRRSIQERRREAEGDGAGSW